MWICKQVLVIIILYYRKILIIAVLEFFEQWLIYDDKTECSFVYVMFNNNNNGQELAT